LFVFAFVHSSRGQTIDVNKDTLSLSLPQAEQQFLTNNLQLLAQKYNVSATQALILQAKLWPNPNLNFVQGAYNTETGKWFQIADPNDAEQAFQLSQLIELAGKIKKQTRIAETNYKLAQYNLADLLRTLKLGLRTIFFNIYYLQETAKVYDEEMNSLKVIINAFEQQIGNGYVTEADLVRMQAQLYSLQNEYQALIDNINDQQSQLRLLLRIPSVKFIKPAIDAATVEAADPRRFGLETLIDSAYQNRTDLWIAKGTLTLSEQTYSLQKALAIPDLTLGLTYDRHGSYVTNFNAVSLGFDIPVFNRNQGNIKSSKLLIDMNKTQLTLTQEMITEQVGRGLQKAIDAEKLYRQINPDFAGHFDKLAAAMLENYQKRYVKLLDFLTFYDSYKQNIVQLNTIRFNRVNSLEYLNFLTGTNFFN
jgi:cobalt-zinc-cadmium efflux system outer membrane protein